MNEINDLVQNIKLIGYFLANKSDALRNEKFLNENTNIMSNIVDLKLADLQFNVGKLANLINLKSVNSNMRKIKICVASSSELKAERMAIEDYIARKNSLLIERGVFLEYNVWERTSTRFTHERKQVDFNKKLVYESEIFICLIGKAVGKFTKEEFLEAKHRFENHEKPYIFYVFFKNYENDPELNKFCNAPEWATRLELMQEVSQLEQVYADYKTTEGLILKINEHIDEDVKIIMEHEVV